MITIFNGRKRTVGGGESVVYAQVDVSMRDNMKLFRQGNDMNSWAVFTCIALHANEDGWSWPSTQTLKEETGFSTDDSISRSVVHLRSVLIGGSPILHHYRAKTKGQWGRSYYHIFPLAGGEDKMPAEDLVRWVTEVPPLDVPGVEQRGDSYKDNQSYKDNHKEDKSAPAPTNKLRRPQKNAEDGGDGDITYDSGDGKKQTQTVSALAIRLKQVAVGHTRKSNARLRSLAAPVQTPGGMWPDPNQLWDTQPYFKEWVESKIAYWAASNERGDEGLIHLINLIVGYKTFSHPIHGYPAYVERRKAEDLSGQYTKKLEDNQVARATAPDEKLEIAPWAKDSDAAPGSLLFDTIVEDE